MSDRNQGRNQLPLASRENTIAHSDDPRTDVVRAWEVKAHLSILVVIIVIWTAWPGGDPTVWGGAFLLGLVSAASRSTIRYLRFTRA
ncbi:hypothetical protein ACFV97_13815 [Streptomyces sp. NPDC059913]|uniref:hypothetical protein n=1 Tax=unclassified Streptomyces TaxID=2593676 RepID=UPI00366A54D5